VTLRLPRWLPAARLPRWLATLPFSLAMHVVFVAAAIAVLRTESTLPPLIVDLRAIIVGPDDGGATPARAPSRASASARTSEPPRSSTRAAERSSAASAPAPPVAPPRAPEPTPPPVPQAPAPAALPAPAPAPPPRVEPAPAPSSAPVGQATNTGSTTVGENAGAVLPGGRAGERAAGASEPGSGAGGSGVGAAAGERIAAIAPGTGSADGTALGSEYAGYYARLRERIQQSLRYPAVAKRRELTGTVELEIAIAADGAIAAVTVIGSSTHEMLDRAAVDAARSVRRIPFPSDVRARPLTVRLPVVFHLRD